MAVSSVQDPLHAFLPPTRLWFERTLGQPTAPQAQGWPAIQRGEHTLILAPTGSGKTLAAFLWGIDQLFHELLAEGADAQDGQPRGARRGSRKVMPTTRLIYISPLKALNNDIERNLRTPLAGIRKAAREMNQALPEIAVAVRSGDTPSRERQAMLRKPPHILITTPESLYILLTSPNAREMFRSVRTVIVDEIHTLAGAKRGVHLALSLERLQQLASQPLQRIGLSATIRPLAEVARFLGGNSWQESDGERTLAPRPVTIVDAGYRKPLDLRVESVVEDFRNLTGESIWPSIVPRVTELIHQHRTTLIFVNNRRLAERAADWINEQMAAEGEASAYGPGDNDGPKRALIEGGVAKGIGMFGAGRGLAPDPIRAHHGSMSKETRLALEQALKSGSLPALVGTSSLELGIDIGAVDLVVQLQSPKTVAQGLQRVGRSGHLVGQTSRGRIFPTHREDVMEAAAVAGGMLRGEVEQTYTPRNSLDVLAQQIVAMVSVEPWPVDELYDLVRCAYPYSDLSQRAYHAVLEMLSGRYPSQAYRELRARLVWDRVNDRLSALPGSRLLALTNGGTITDRGAFGAYLSDGKTKLGELDEEFVYETRVGDTLLLGSQVWRVVEMTDDRVIVADAAGATPRMPFWRGDFPWRSFDLGERVGAFRRAVAERLQSVHDQLDLAAFREIRTHEESAPVQALIEWLRHDYALDTNSAWHVMDYVAGQLDHAGAISSDRTVLVELFDDALGDPRLVIQTPFGGKVNGLWALALASTLRERTSVNVEVQSNDDGILFRFPEADAEIPLDLVTEVGPDEARERILRELAGSAVFGAQFRQNAARALLLPGLRGGKRTPFWLQRLRAKDLLQIVRRFDDFPIVAETYRDCLEEVMDWPHLEAVLNRIRNGEIQVTVIESLTPSPVAQSLMWDFISIYMYEWDAPKSERQLQELTVNRELLQDLLKDVNLADLLRPEAVTAVHSRLQHMAPGTHARTVEELASLFQQLGDLSSAEVAERCAVDPSGWIGQLAGDQRIVSAAIPTTHGPVPRWVAAEYAAEYAAAFDLEIGQNATPSITPDEARQRILVRFLGHAGPVTAAAIQARYALPTGWLQQTLDHLVEHREVVHGRFTPAIETSRGDATPPEFVDRRTLEQMHRRTLTILRQEIRPVPFTVYADFLARWQHIHPQERLAGPGALRQAIQQLRAAPVIGRVWERDVLPLRLASYDPSELAALCQSGELVWVGTGGADPRRSRFRFLFRGEGSIYLEAAPADMNALGADAQAVYAFLRSEGALFQSELQEGLGLANTALEAALLELALAGLVTNDSLAVLQGLMQHGGSQAPREPFSKLEAELAARLGSQAERLGSLRRPSRSEYQAAKRKVRKRLEQADSLSQPAGQAGRWAVVHRFGVLGKPLPSAEQAARQARQLLARYGVVTYAVLENEYGAWNWSQIYAELQRLELRGEIRRGYFVQGLAGVQFALPEVVERLRHLAGGEQKPVNDARATAAGPDEPLVLMNACDPANLYGPANAATPTTASGAALTFSRVPSTWLVLSRGLPVLVIEDSGSRLSTTEGASEELQRRSLESWLLHVASFETRVQVTQWNGEPVLHSAAQPLLEAVGFFRDYPGMTWHKR
ncbi:MAG: DEAD/DEAH box helicase [Caldilineaceae bacterium]|nr:DEAD/DEAH box helicase [Caldilineaceae bacterium]